MRLADLVDERDGLDTLLKDADIADPHRTDSVDLHAGTDVPERAHADTAAPSAGGVEVAPTAVHADQVDTFHFQGARLDGFVAHLDMTGLDAQLTAQAAQDILRVTG